MSDIAGIKLLLEPTRERLSERQQVDYANHREDLIEWLLHFGKDPEKVDGYAHETVKSTAQRLDRFYRWVWDEYEGYTTEITHEYADAFMRELARRDESDYSRNNTQSTIKWQKHERGGELWEPEIVFTEPQGTTQPRDFLTREERSKIREAALEYGSISSYSDLTPEECDRWKGYLAQRLSKRKTDVSSDDWKKANSWKFPSLVWSSLDAGLRPIEVERAKTTWVDTENAVLRIPRAESSKNEGNWTVSLPGRTANALDRWLTEREHYDLYDETDALWLTRFGNPYNRSSLRRVLLKLFEIAGIPSENRQVSWYTIRHSVGTYLTQEADLAATQTQLRHKSPETTMRYDQTPVEDRRDALDRMG